MSPDLGFAAEGRCGAGVGRVGISPGGGVSGRNDVTRHPGWLWPGHDQTAGALSTVEVPGWPSAGEARGQTHRRGCWRHRQAGGHEGGPRGPPFYRQTWGGPRGPPFYRQDTRTASQTTVGLSGRRLVQGRIRQRRRHRVGMHAVHSAWPRRGCATFSQQIYRYNGASLVPRAREIHALASWWQFDISSIAASGYSPAGPSRWDQLRVWRRPL